MSGREALMAQYLPVDQRLLADMDLYGRHLVRIKDKDGQLKPFLMNEAQRRVHEIIERQWEKKRHIRAIILKARQLGISTYVGVRFYRGTTLRLGRRTFILTHEDPATENLFNMVKRIHDNMDPEFKPRATSNAAKALDFGGLDSGYRVGTAGNRRGVGRSATILQFHGSEVAFWPAAAEHISSAFQAVPLDLSEMILESTANGPTGEFYNMWVQAEAGRSDLIAIFLPWTIAVEYSRKPEPGWNPSDAIGQYGELHGLTPHQMRWMQAKCAEIDPRFDGTKIPWRFRQEYPINAQEAFQTSGIDSYLDVETIVRARKWDAPDQSHAARVAGLDIARGGGDFSRLIDRQGRRMGRINLTIDVRDLMVIADRAAALLNQNPDILMLFIDVTGLGAGVYDRLRQMGFASRITPVNFGQAPLDEKRFRNKRSEMIGLFGEWLADPGGADIPDDDSLQRHLSVGSSGYGYDANSRLFFPPKEKLKADHGFSPDGLDAGALTFAAPVAIPEIRRESWMDEHRDAGSDALTFW